MIPESVSGRVEAIGNGTVHKYDRAECVQYNAETTRIDRDREYDQTAKTEACPVCLSVDCLRPAASTDTPAIIGTNADRSVSPAILEFRSQELDAENRDLKEKLRVAYERITGFEKFYASFARKVDEFEMMFMNLTGSTAGDFAKRVDRAAAAMPKTASNCRQ